MNRADDFRTAMETVLGQAMQAAGYALEHNPLQWSSGLFRFRRVTDHAALIVIIQLLAHEEFPSKFQVTLVRAPHEGTGAFRISLPHLLWDEFDVWVLPERDHWWRFSHGAELGECLLEAGKLLVGFGLPWLDGSLSPGDSQS